MAAFQELMQLMIYTRAQVRPCVGPYLPPCADPVWPLSGPCLPLSGLYLAPI